MRSRSTNIFRLPWQICGRCDWREADRRFKRRPKGTESVDLRQSAPNWLSLGTAPPPQLCAGHSGIEAVSLWESSGRYHAYSTISQPGGPRDGRTAGGALSSPRASKIALTTLASTMVAITRTWAPTAGAF